MAQNQNNHLPNNHALICGQSGGGKTTFVLQHKELKRAKRVIYWDPYSEFACKNRVKTARELRGYLSGALRGKTGFKVAMSVGKNVKPEEMTLLITNFFDEVWRIADGNHLTYVVVEELSDAFDTVAKAHGRSGQVFRAGRKFGLALFALTQSCAEIPKTIVKQCGTKVVFYHDEPNDVKRAAEIAWRTPDEVRGLIVGQHFIRLPGMKDSELRRTRKLS